MKVALVILNYNSSGDCRKCIADLKLQTGVEMEIIVVDNCSRDDDRLVVETLCEDSGCTFIANPENCGYNAGNNIGLRYAAEKGFEYAMICNPDMQFPQRDYLEKMAVILRDNTEVAVAATDILHADGYHQNPMKPDGGWFSSLQWIRNLFRHNTKDEALIYIDNWRENHYCHKVSGCCFMIRMSFLKQINFFDEYPFLYCEEAILARQVETAGMRMFYLSNCQAVHRHIKGMKGDPAPRLRQFLRSRIYCQKHYTNDSRIGKIIAISSWFFYVYILVAFYRFQTIIRISTTSK